MTEAAPPSNQPEIDRFRVALKFSLWAWALYWFGGGALLFLFGGLNLAGILVLIGSLVTFVLLLMSGALRTTSSRNMKEFLLERPMYFIGALVAVALVVPMLSIALDGFLIIGATVYFGSTVYALDRLLKVYRTQDKPFLQSGLDQAVIAVGMSVLVSFLLFADAWLYMANEMAISGPPATVALANWLSILYPPLLLLGTRGLREPLHKPRITVDEDAPAADATES